MANATNAGTNFKSFDDVRRAFAHLKVTGVFSALTGDVTSTAGSSTTTIAALAVTAAKLAADAVTTAKILDSNVTVAKLADAVQDLIYTHTFTSNTPKVSPNDITFTLQVKDAAGNALAGRFMLRVRMGTADYGAPAAGFVFTALTAGTLIQAVTANQDYWWETDATGLITFTGNKAAAGTLYLMATLNSKSVSTTAVWT